MWERRFGSARPNCDLAAGRLPLSPCSPSRGAEKGPAADCRAPIVEAETLLYAPRTEDGSTFTPGPMVEEIATRWM
jgi:hypothetical protein